MMVNRKRSIISIGISFAFLLASCHNQNNEDEMLIKIHYGHSIKPTVIFPENQSIENNIYLDFIKEELGIEIIYDWVCEDSEYDQKIDLCIASNTLPDMMYVNERQFRKMIMDGQIQPITQAFEEHASEKLKEIVQYGEGTLLDTVMVNGEMMAIPVPNIDSHVNALWIRQDWLDTLGLAVPTTMDELERLAQAFITQDPDGNGLDDTIGILGPSSFGTFTALGGNQWGLDPIFAAYKSFPGAWLHNDKGEIYYGSLTNETRNALEKLATMYSNGTLDSDLFLRNDSLSVVLEGKCGIFFGPWWSGYSMVTELLKGEMDWSTHMIPLSLDGNYYNKMPAPTDKYIVVSKNNQYPHAAIQIINFLLQEEEGWVAQGFNSIVSISSAYPLFQVYDNPDEIDVSFNVLDKWLQDEISMNNIDFSKHKLLKNDMEMIKILKKEPLDNFSIRYWDLTHSSASANLGRLYSLMVGQRVISTEGYEPIVSLYYGYTNTMLKTWERLKDMENQTFNRIVMGDAPIELFDEFVEKWYTSGGEIILKEIEDIVNN